MLTRRMTTMIFRRFVVLSAFLTILVNPRPGCAQGAELRVERIDFGADLLDWHAFDWSGDERTDFLGILEDDSGLRRVALAVQNSDGTFGSPQTTNMPKGATAIVLGSWTRPTGTDIGFVHPGGVTLITASDKSDAAKTPTTRPDFVPARTLFRAAGDGAPAFWHWPTDIDDDGTDDLFLPTEDGLAVWFGQRGGTFETPVTLPIPGERTIDRHGGFVRVTRSYPRPVFANVVGDTRLDLAWFDESGLTGIEQTAPKKFAATKPVRFPLPWIASREQVGVLEQTDVDLEALDSDIEDDLVLARMRTETGLAEAQTTIFMLLNRRGAKEKNDAKDGKTDLFSRSPDAAVRAKGIVGVGPHFVDLDRDGVRDLVYVTYASKVGQALSRLFNRVPVKLFIHNGRTTGNRYSGTPDQTLKLDVPRGDFERWSARNSVFLRDDVTGDDVVDLVHVTRKSGKRSVTVRPGVLSDGNYSIADDASFAHAAPDVEDVSVRTLTETGPASIVVVGKKSITVLWVK